LKASGIVAAIAFAAFANTISLPRQGKYSMDLHWARSNGTRISVA
jgi:hypothetical protein